MDLFRRKSVTDLQAEALTDHSLKRALGALNLTMLGIGAIIGTGIFVLTGTVAALNAGPAVVLSFVLAGVASIFAALCYSEFASLVPMAGSAYTYGYATLGEVIAWIIGWDLILEYALGAVTVAIGWSGYVVSFLHDVGLDVPGALAAARGTPLIQVPGGGWRAVTDALLQSLTARGVDPNTLPHVTAIFNLPAVIIIAIITTLLVIGIKESANVNNVIVFVKVAVVLLFIVGAAHAINPANWHPFMPPNTGARGEFGWTGVMTGAGIVFFAYIGFDAVSTAAQEAKNPQKDMPIGIIGSLLICTVLYILVSGIATGVVSYKELNVPDPIAVAADHAPRHVARAIARILFDVARRPAAAVRQQGAPPVPDPVHHLDRHGHCRRVCRFAPDGARGGQPRLDRHAPGLRDRLGRCAVPPGPRAGPGAPVQDSDRVGRGAAGRGLGALSHGLAAVAHLGAVDHLVRLRDRDLLRVRRAELDSGEAALGSARCRAG